MVWSDEIEAFVEAHIRDDVRLLALHKQPLEGDGLRTALMQIELRQRMMDKLPSFAATRGIYFPSRLATEQCSSEESASLKRKIVGIHCEKGADLTGGMGVDTVALSVLCDRMTYVEQNPELCEAARHNLPLFAGNIAVRQTTAEEWLDESDERIGFIFVDPARRDSHGGKVFRIGDCTPDIMRLMPRLKARAAKVVVKLSPMLDVKECIEALSPERVVIVSVRNECKEVIAVVTDAEGETVIETVELHHDECFRMSFTLTEEASATPLYATGISVGEIIAEPYAGFMKSGAWKMMCQRYNARMVAPSSHLYIAGGSFPGRCFRVTEVAEFNKSNAKRMLKGKANVAVRNFPMSVAEVRRRFGTEEGGERYVFLTTDRNGVKVIIEGEKV